MPDFCLIIGGPPFDLSRKLLEMFPDPRFIVDDPDAAFYGNGLPLRVQHEPTLNLS